ncbi:metallophosphoesterase [Puteibacter caeruleilacunae]|nr:metallophosphoesterase [Puteibacter caeruleilacunae]
MYLNFLNIQKSKNFKQMKRRTFIASSLVGALTVPTLGASLSSDRSKERVLRIAHLTDMHIFSDSAAERGINNLLEQLNTLDVKPDIVINTGDNIMDALKKNKTEVDAQWKAWKSYFKNQMNFELYNCIGNHDVWGWGLKNTKVKKEKLYGKAWAMDMLELSQRFYSFDKGGWHIICLDSPFKASNSHAYTAKLDQEQFEWLENDLKDTPSDTPILLASHIPILAPSVFFDGDNEKSGDWNIPGSWMHIDARRIKDLLRNYPNIKMAISGHVHLADHVNYLGVDYFCNGAACGGWWKGKYQEFGPSYALIDLYSDGSYTNQLKSYNWK